MSNNVVKQVFKGSGMGYAAQIKKKYGEDTQAASAHDSAAAVLKEGERVLKKLLARQERECRARAMDGNGVRFGEASPTTGKKPRSIPGKKTALRSGIKPSATGIKSEMQGSTYRTGGESPVHIDDNELSAFDRYAREKQQERDDLAELNKMRPRGEDSDPHDVLRDETGSGMDLGRDSESSEAECGDYGTPGASHPGPLAGKNSGKTLDEELEEQYPGVRDRIVGEAEEISEKISEGRMDSRDSNVKTRVEMIAIALGNSDLEKIILSGNFHGPEADRWKGKWAGAAKAADGLKESTQRRARTGSKAMDDYIG
jgi:hypothetical protein